MAVLMVRHTRPLVAEGICYGQTDLDVADNFEKEAGTVVERLPIISHILSSPLKRCRKLADHVGKCRGLSVETDTRLMEMDFGRWEGLAWNAFPRPELDAWADDFYHANPHGGESVADLKARTDAVLIEVRARADQTLVVTHAGIIRAALAPGIEAKHFQTKIKFGEIVRLPDPEKRCR